jgi:hypothetical protein
LQLSQPDSAFKARDYFVSVRQSGKCIHYPGVRDEWPDRLTHIPGAVIALSAIRSGGSDSPSAHGGRRTSI